MDRRLQSEQCLPKSLSSLYGLGSPLSCYIQSSWVLELHLLGSHRSAFWLLHPSELLPSLKSLQISFKAALGFQLKTTMQWLIAQLSSSLPLNYLKIKPYQLTANWKIIAEPLEYSKCLHFIGMSVLLIFQQISHFSCSLLYSSCFLLDSFPASLLIQSELIQFFFLFELTTLIEFLILLQGYFLKPIVLSLLSLIQ